MQLVDGEVEVAIRSDRQGIRPKNSRVLRDSLPLTAGLELPDTIPFVVSSVNASLVVRLKPVRSALFSQIDYRLGECFFRRRPIS